MQYIAQHAQVENTRYGEGTARIEALIPANRLEQLRRFGDDARVLSERVP
jgi:hypothetical protein